MTHGGRASAKRSRARSHAKSFHFFEDAAGLMQERAAFTEPNAQAAQRRVFERTGRRYSAYECQWSQCGAWHIRPLPLRPEDLAWSA